MGKHILLALLALAASSASAQFRPTIPASGVTFSPPEVVMPPNKQYVDLTTIPRPRYGTAEARIFVSCGPLVGSNPAAECANSRYPLHKSGEPAGAFRVNCRMSHWSFDDPIVWPRQAAMTHLHQFFGNTTTDAQTDPSKMDEFGKSTCMGGIINRTGYWVPVFIKVCPSDEVGCNHAEHGKVFPAFENIVYYKNETALHAMGTGTWLPKGFRMIMGDANNVDPARIAGFYDCFGPNTENPGTGVGLRYYRLPSAQENIDSRIDTGNPQPACKTIRMTIHFPQPLCSIADESILYLPTPNGGTHSGHIAQGVYGSGCTDPAFPHLRPDISYNVDTVVENNADYDYLMLSSDPPPQRGVTQSGSTTTTVKLAASERTLTDVYKYGWLTINGQRKRISAYNGTTKVVTLESALTGAPTTGTAYIVRQPAGLSMHGDWANGWDQNPNFMGWGRSITDQIIRGCWYNIPRYGNPASGGYSLILDCGVANVGDPGSDATAEPRVGATYYFLY